MLAEFYHPFRSSRIESSSPGKGQSHSANRNKLFRMQPLIFFLENVFCRYTKKKDPDANAVFLDISKIKRNKKRK